VIDLVVMPSKLWDMKYLVLAKTKLSNFIEGRALRTKSIEGVCKFVLEDIFQGCLIRRVRGQRRR
jgi:hypothetical protein